MNKILAVVAAAACLALAGCAGENIVSKAPADTASAAAPAATPTAPAAPAAAAFGDTVKFPSGVTVSVTAASAAAGQYAAGAVDGKIVVVTIKVTNGSDKQINGGLMSVPKVSYGAAGTQAKSAVDTGHAMSMISTVLPGETQTGTESFGIPAAEFGNVRVEITSPTLTDKPAVFKGAIQ